MNDVFETHHRLGGQKQCATIASQRVNPRVQGHQAGKATDTNNDQQRVGDRAAQAYPEHVMFANALFEHEGVLSANGQNKTETQTKAGDQGVECAQLAELCRNDAP